MTEKRGRGRPPHQPTEQLRKEVEGMAGVGVPQPDICKILGISLPTLHKHYPAELDRGMAKADAEVRRSLFLMATKDKNVTAAIFWAKVRLGWNEKQMLEVTGKDGGPVQIESEQRATAALTDIFGQIAAAKASLH